jgi:hypothetical protein
MIQYLKDQYLAVIIIVIWIFFTLYNQNKNTILIEQTKKLEAKILVLEEKDYESGKIIDSLSRVDTVIVNRIKIIKQKEYVQIRIIDSMPVSGLQRYFTDRYEKK